MDDLSLFQNEIVSAIATTEHSRELAGIFNRWGEMIFTTSDPESGWDGKYKNGDAEIGVYYYDIELESPDNRKIHYKGDLTLVR